MGGSPSYLMFRFAAQALTGAKATSAEEVTSRLLAVQAQDLRGARLAVRPRSVGLVAADVDTALSERRSLVVSWLNRTTLHMVCAEDFWWLRQLTIGQAKTANRRRLAQEGVSPTQATAGVDVIVSALAARPRTRAELRQLLASAGIPVAGQALVQLLLAATIAEPVVRGPLDGAEQCFALAAIWLGPPPSPLEPDEGLARLAERYLAGHGPASAEDLARWSGLTLGAARRGLAAGAGIVSAGDGRSDLAARAEPPATFPEPLLAGPFDPLLHGWASRGDITGGHTSVITSNGLFRPFALVAGRVVATWGLAGGRVTLHRLEDIDEAAAAALDADAGAVVAFLSGRPAATAPESQTPAPPAVP